MTDPTERNKAIAREEFGIWSGGDVDELDRLVAPDVLHHDPYDPHASDGLEGLKKSIAANRAAFPDLHIAIEDQVAEGDRVATRWVATMTHRGEFMGIAPSGARATVRGITIERFADGLIVESWRQMDTMALLGAIGALAPR